jgi:hypothetical protein
MKKKYTISIAASLLVLTMAASPATAINLTFEEFIGSNGGLIGSFYSGISFESGLNGDDWFALDAGTGFYNVSSYPSGTILGGDGNFWLHGQVGALTQLTTTSSSDGVIRFDNADATFVEVSYASNSTMTFEAYTSGDVLIDTDSGAANLRFANGNAAGPGTMRVDWNGTDHIAYVIMHDAGNGWVADNVTTDATGIEIIPAPGAALLGILGMGTVGWFRRRFV